MCEKDVSELVSQLVDALAALAEVRRQSSLDGNEFTYLSDHTARNLTRISAETGVVFHTNIDIALDEIAKTEKKILSLFTEKQLAKEKYAHEVFMLILNESDEDIGRRSFISDTGFKNFCVLAEDLLRKSGTLSPRDFIEKKFPQKSKKWLELGVDLFLIKAFEKAVAEGRVEDMDISDSPSEHHAFRHKESDVSMVSRNANDDPALSLGD